MPTVEISISGMTCQSCELRVKRRLLRLDGVTSAKVSARQGTATVISDRRVPAADLQRAVHAAGYTVAEPPREDWLARDPRVWRDVGLAVLALVLLAGALRFGAVSLPSLDLGATNGPDGARGASASLLAALALGLAAGFSTCMAMVGGLVLAVSARHAEQHRDDTWHRRLRPQLVFNLGRVAGFAVLGALLGAVGSAFTLEGTALAVVMVGVALVMGVVGFQLTHVSPRISRVPVVALPSGLAVRLGLDQAGTTYADGRAALLGAGTFLLPCGITQAVQVFALSTGDPWQASAVMTAFALGTLPGLLAIGGLASAVRGRVADSFVRFAGVAALAFAVVNLTAALGLTAPVYSPGPDDGEATAAATVTMEDGVQVLRTIQHQEGYAPHRAVVYRGVPVRWEITSEAMGCASYLDAEFVAASPVMLRYGQNSLTFTLARTGTYRYSCVMGMYEGAIRVIDPPAARSGT